MHQWHVSENSEQAAEAAVNFIVKAIKSCLQKKEECHVILPGGNSPARSLELLSRENLPWEKIHWYPGDERVCPKGNENRNDEMIQRNFISKLPVNNLHRFQTEQGADNAIELFNTENNKLSVVDIAYLGMGEDGHTASLFPDNDALVAKENLVAVFDSPKPPAERVSFSLSVLNAVPVKIVLTTGKSKNDAIKKIKNNESLPVNCIGDIYWFVDTEAYS